MAPFVRDSPGPVWRARLQRTLIRLALLPPWGPVPLGASEYRRFLVGKGRDAKPVPMPAWIEEHVCDIRRSLEDRSRLRSLRALVGQLTHRPVERRLDAVQAPAIVVMGSRDPDFPDPAAELTYIQRRLGRPGRPATGVLIPGCGHYPHRQRPDVVGPQVVRFVAGVAAGPEPDPDGDTPADGDRLG